MSSQSQFNLYSTTSHSENERIIIKQIVVLCRLNYFLFHLCVQFDNNVYNNKKPGSKHSAKILESLYHVHKNKQ